MPIAPDTFSVISEVAAAVEEDGLLSLFSFCRDGDLRPLADVARRYAPEALEGQERFIRAKDRPGTWPDLLAEALEVVAAKATAGRVFSGGGWDEGLKALGTRCRIGSVVAGEAALAEAIAATLLGTSGTVATALADERVRGVEPLAEAVLHVALLRRILRSRLGLPAPAVSAVPSTATPPVSPGSAKRLLERLAGGADVWDDVLASVPGADFARLPPCNIAVAGRSGVGKSTLLNAVFGRDLAATGAGRPVTRDATWYEEPGFSVRLLDTRGLERGAFAESLAALEAKLTEARAGTNADEQLHLLWLCLDGSGSRIEEADRRVAEMAGRLGVLVVLVVTKAWFDSELPAIVRAELPDPPVRAVVRVIASSRKFESGESVGPEGLETLIEESLRLLPEAERAAMVAVQRILLAPKVESARDAIRKAGNAAFLAASTPIPFTDAVLLAPIQIAMIVAVTRRMGVTLSEDGWKALAAAVAGPVLATFADRRRHPRQPAEDDSRHRLAGRRVAECRRRRGADPIPRRGVSRLAHRPARAWRRSVDRRDQGLSRRRLVSEAIGEERVPGDGRAVAAPETERQHEQRREPAGEAERDDPAHAGAGVRTSGRSAIGACRIAAAMPSATDAHQIAS